MEGVERVDDRINPTDPIDDIRRRLATIRTGTQWGYATPAAGVAFLLAHIDTLEKRIAELEEAAQPLATAVLNVPWHYSDDYEIMVPVGPLRALFKALAGRDIGHAD